MNGNIGRRWSILNALAAAALVCTACGEGSAPGGDGRAPLTIGVAFETLQTEFWVAAWNKLRADTAARGITMLEAVADGDPNRQFEQVRTFINRRVDGIILVPKDGKTVIPMIRAANAAGIPVVLFNRPADRTDAPHTTIAPDNFAITRETVAYLVDQVRASGRKAKAAVLLGDLSDVNAIERRDGFEAAIRDAGDLVEVVARIPTAWNQEKALAGFESAMQAHPDINFVFTSSDFMLPSIKSVLSARGRWKKVGEPGHVLLAGFDGDPTAYGLMVDGYVDATGVQDVFWEAEQAIRVIEEAKAGTPPPARLDDPGFVITQANLSSLAGRMWGAVMSKRAEAP
ncbi:MAG: substrate-binding domain-containing protein [Luteitalea sp.]|nr:substrate-binding domain-containing protein [Luteitalea sp.]